MTNALSDPGLAPVLYTLSAYAERLQQAAESWQIQDPQQASTTLQQIYSPHRLSLFGASDNFHMAFARCALGRLELATLSFGAEVELAQSWTGDFVLVSTQLSGRARISTVAGEFEGAQGLVVVDSPDHPVTKRFSHDSRRLHVRIARQSVDALASRLHGGAPPQLQACLTPGDGRHARWLALLHLLVSHAGPALAAPWHPVFEEMAIMALLNELLPSPCMPLSVAAPRHVCRAEAFMRAHLDEPQTLARIAEAADTSIRSLNAGFRQYRDTTPMRWLHEQRLLAAHDALRRSGDGMTVAMVANRMGLPHLGRFARDYRRRFGISPAETLRSA